MSIAYTIDPTKIRILERLINPGRDDFSTDYVMVGALIGYGHLTFKAWPDGGFNEHLFNGWINKSHAPGSEDEISANNMMVMFIGERLEDLTAHERMRLMRALSIESTL